MRLYWFEELVCELGRKLYLPSWDDLLSPQYLHQRYRNYQDWLAG